MLEATYLVPVKAAVPPDAEFTAYLEAISRQCQLVIVDGSEPAVFEAAHRAWHPIAVHLPVAADLRCANGKVAGVLTGMRHAGHEQVVIADDDVRYDPEALRRTIDALEHADLVNPQNHFDPLPWWSRWDTARSLINRAWGRDFPGTLAVRRSVLDRTGGYDGNVLFENVELIRTVRAAGGRVVAPLDLYVARRPPTAAHFWRQRVRQAYEERARPLSFAVALAVVPSVVVARHRRRRLAAIALASIGLAERGRRRSGGTSVFPPTSALLAPVWVAERSICTWVAVGARLRGGCRYGDARIVRAATPERVLRRRLAPRPRVP